MADRVFELDHIDSLRLSWIQYDALVLTKLHSLSNLMNLHYRLPYFSFLNPPNLFFSEKSFLYVYRLLIFRSLKRCEPVHIVLQLRVEVLLAHLRGLYSRILGALDAQLVLTLRRHLVDVRLDKGIGLRGDLRGVFFEGCFL